MVSITGLCLAATVALSAVAAPTASSDEKPSKVKRNTPNETGTNGGFYYQFWSDGTPNVNYQNGAGGNYQVTWDNPGGDFTSGKGWQQAAPRNISFSGTFTPGSNSYLAVYTWSMQGETYILENFGEYNPGSAGTHEGTLYSDGSTYDVYMVNRGNNYIQYWSIRQNKRSSGVVTTANHYNWYESHGLTHNPNSAAAYQILSTEGYGSQGQSDMTVGEVTGGSSPPPSSTSTSSQPPSSTSTKSQPTTTSSGGGGSSSGGSPQWGQCGGQGWTGPTTCQSPYTCHYSNPYYSQCY